MWFCVCVCQGLEGQPFLGATFQMDQPLLFFSKMKVVCRGVTTNAIFRRGELTWAKPPVLPFSRILRYITWEKYDPKVDERKRIFGVCVSTVHVLTAGLVRSFVYAGR